MFSYKHHKLTVYREVLDQTSGNDWAGKNKQISSYNTWSNLALFSVYVSICLLETNFYLFNWADLKLGTIVDLIKEHLKNVWQNLNSLFKNCVISNYVNSLVIYIKRVSLKTESIKLVKLFWKLNLIRLISKLSLKSIH